MKGIVFNIFESFLVEHHGRDFFYEVVDESNLITEEPFVSPGTYPYEDLLEILGVTCRKLEISPEDALRAFGKYSFKFLDEKYPEYKKKNNTPILYLEGIEEIIHQDVKKLYPDAKPPVFKYEKESDHHLQVEYISERKLCHFMEGLIEGIEELFSRKISYSQLQCVHSGAKSCIFKIELHIQN
jgi:predicted hydrocarbon binding protein